MRRRIIAITVVVVVVLGLRYSLREETRLFARDAAGGQVVWSAAPLGARRLGPPVTSYGRVIVEAGDGNAGWSVVALDATSGKRLWIWTPGATLGDAVGALDTFPVLPITTAGAVYVHVRLGSGSASKSRLIALDADSGTVRWTIDRRWSAAAHTLGVAALQDQVYILEPTTGEQTALVARDAATGETVWHVDLAQPALLEGEDSELLATDHLLIMRGPGGPTTAYDRLTGSPLFTIAGSGKQIALDDHTIYQLDTGTLAAFDSATGTLRWTYARSEATCGGKPGFLTRMSVSSDAVYAGCMRLDGSIDAGGVVLALDPATGDERWHTDVARYGSLLLFQPPAAGSATVAVRGQLPTGAPGVLTLGAPDGAELWHIPTADSRDRLSTDGRLVFYSDRGSRWHHWLQRLRLLYVRVPR